MSNLLVVMLGCALGGAMRYLITTYINKLGYNWNDKKNKRIF